MDWMSSSLYIYIYECLGILLMVSLLMRLDLGGKEEMNIYLSGGRHVG